jgi:hypothetical protein
MRPEKEHKQPISKGWVSFFTILLCILMIPALLIIPINKTLFEPKFYNQVLTKQKFFQQLPDVILGSVAQVAEKQAPPAAGINLLGFFTETQLKELLIVAIPAGWLEGQTDHAITSILDYINYNTNELTITIDLQPIKNNLTAETGKQMFLIMLNSLPDCDIEQLLTMVETLAERKQVEFNLCKPPLEDVSLFDPLLEAFMSQVSNAVPTQVEFPRGAQKIQIEKLTASPVFVIYKLVRQSMNFLPWVCLGIGLMIILFAAPSLRLLFSSIGITGLVAGSTGGLIGFLLMRDGNVLVETLFNQNAQVGQLQIGNLFKEVIQEGIRGTGSLTLAFCVGAFGLGLIFFVISRFLRK